MWSRQQNVLINDKSVSSTKLLIANIIGTVDGSIRGCEGHDANARETSGPIRIITIHTYIIITFALSVIMKQAQFN